MPQLRGTLPVAPSRKPSTRPSSGTSENTRLVRTAPLANWGPVFNRCHDYYADAKFSGEEPPLLCAEVQYLKTQFPRSADVLEFLACLEQACRDAQDGGLQLFGFGD